MLHWETKVPKDEPADEPRTLVEPSGLDNWTHPAGTRVPSCLLGAIIRKFWLGFYTTNGERKIAATWRHYELADCPPYGKASYAVIHKFWFRPDWAYGKEEAWTALIARWRGEDEEWNALSERNKANHGSGGTHRAGNLGSERYKAILAEDPNYLAAVVGFNPKVDDPRAVDPDERALVVSGGGLQHGRLRVLDKVTPRTATLSLTRIKATLNVDDPAPPPQRRPSRPCYDAAFEAAYKAHNDAYLLELAEWRQKAEAHEAWKVAKEEA
ncbi:hypothetical protein ZWY2020_017957 [Hordeum vulgare]|nr:hypothetical protein ZWY2020_017957 [Hordeum vulgare]